MSDHHERHGGEEHRGPGFHGDGERQKEPGRKWHKDWRVWTVVIILLASLAAYVLTLDDFYALIGQPRAKAPVSQPAAP
jgi:hypothetical protein